MTHLPPPPPAAPEPPPAAWAPPSERSGGTRRKGPWVIGLATVGAVVLLVAVQAASSGTPGEPTCDARGDGSLYEMASDSMAPTIDDGATVLVVPGEPTARDIVVFNATWFGDPSPMLERVIGMPGDTVEVRSDGRVHVNGLALDEPYLFRDEAGIIEPTKVPQDQAPWVVPEGQLFVMGDHRQQSADSRVFGPIRTADVIGIVTWTCRPQAVPIPAQP